MSPINPIYLNDSAPLEASIYLEEGVVPVTPTSASWDIKKPDGRNLIVAVPPTALAVGERVVLSATWSAIAPFHTLEWNGTAWADLGVPLANMTLTANTTAYLVPTWATYIEGVYRARAKFILADGSQRSQFVNFEVVDPLAISTTDPDKTIDMAWMFLEDCFDSDLGGPYLRDVTLANFDKKKMALLAPNALFTIGIKPPATTYTIDNFPYTTAMPLLAKGLLIESVKHLMRSYTEQPLVTGAGQISYFDRRDYLTRWQTIYTLEMEEFKHWLALFKRGEFNFGSGSLLIDLKSGRRQMYPQLDRARGRYWY